MSNQRNTYVQKYCYRYKYHQVLDSLHKEYGPVVKEDIGGRVLVHAFDPEDIKTVRKFTNKVFLANDIFVLGLLLRRKVSNHSATYGNRWHLQVIPAGKL